MTLEEIKAQAVKEFVKRFDPLTYTDSEGGQKIPPATFLFEAIQPWLRTTLDKVAEAATKEAVKRIAVSLLDHPTPAPEKCCEKCYGKIGIGVSTTSDIHYCPCHSKEK